MYRIRVFLAVPKVLSLNTASGLLLILRCTEELLQLATVPPRRRFSRNYRVKCALLKIPMLVLVFFFFPCFPSLVLYVLSIWW